MPTTLIVLVVTVFSLIYVYIRRRYSYWARKNVPYIEPKIFYGNSEKLFKETESFAGIFLDFYKQMKSRGAKHGGFYVLFGPAYVPLDPELIKYIMQKDFDNFMDRGVFVNEETDPLTGHLFSLEGAQWRNLRAKLTPTFTSGKMRMMFNTLVECSKGLEEMLSEYSKIEEPLDIKEIVARFTTDIIGSCAFGLECNTMKNPDTEFRTYGRKIFDSSNTSKAKQIVAALAPRFLVTKLGIRITDKDIEDFFIKIVKDSVSYRKENNISRNDFLHLLIELMKDDANNDIKNNKTFKTTDDSKSVLTINQVAAQCFVFFAAGFETSSTTTTFALYELSLNEEVQERLREEIITVLGKYDNKITYESISEMVYLEKVLNETLRKYPPVPVLQRVCTKTSKLPITDVTIEKGIPVMIPVIGLHYDPEYYPDPEVFDPERFSEENKAKRPPFVFLPFGDGPRVCIGLRFGKLQTKLGLITILRNYKVTLNDKTKTPIELDKTAFILSVEGGVWLNITKI